MDALRDSTHIGMFEPHELDLLHGVFTRLTTSQALGLNEDDARSLARSIITLYRHGVRDPEQLFGALQVEAS